MARFVSRTLTSQKCANLSSYNVRRIGLSYQASYTYSKSIDDTSAVLGGLPANAGVILQTLPQNPFDCHVCDANLIVPFNNQLSAIARNEGAVVVDLYQAFAPHVNDWLSSDGLHPNETGYQQIAQVFFNALKGVYELPASMGSSLGSPRSSR